MRQVHGTRVLVHAGAWEGWVRVDGADGHLLTEGLTWTNSGLALGFSAGTTIGGIVIDAHGTTWSFVLPVISAGIACVVATLGQRTLLRASVDRPQPAPTVAWNTDPLPGPGPGAIIDDPQRG